MPAAASRPEPRGIVLARELQHQATGSELPGNWQEQYAKDVAFLLREIDWLREQVNSARASREGFEGLPEGTLPRV